eukprot:SAG11_NODE_1344_length_5148_cov_5.463260_3_plen_128_part_00
MFIEQRTKQAAKINPASTCTSHGLSKQRISRQHEIEHTRSNWATKFKAGRTNERAKQINENTLRRLHTHPARALKRLRTHACTHARTHAPEIRESKNIWVPKAEEVQEHLAKEVSQEIHHYFTPLAL